MAVASPRVLIISKISILASLYAVRSVYIPYLTPCKVILNGKFEQVKYPGWIVFVHGVSIFCHFV